MWGGERQRKYCFFILRRCLLWTYTQRRFFSAFSSASPRAWLAPMRCFPTLRQVGAHVCFTHKLLGCSAHSHALAHTHVHTSANARILTHLRIHARARFFPCIPYPLTAVLPTANSDARARACAHVGRRDGLINLGHVVLHALFQRWRELTVDRLAAMNDAISEFEGRARASVRTYMVWKRLSDWKDGGGALAEEHRLCHRRTYPLFVPSYALLWLAGKNGGYF